MNKEIKLNKMKCRHTTIAVKIKITGKLHKQKQILDVIIL